VVVVEIRESSRSDGTSVVSVVGEMDLAVVAEFLDHALACLDRADALAIDLAGVSFIDSSGLGALVRVRKEATDRGKPLSLVNVSRATHRLLEITGLQDAFEITEKPA
jgi:anti-sigma B factor antagonist